MIESITPVGIESTQAATASPSAADPKASAHDMRDFAAAMERNGGTQATQATEPAAVQETNKAPDAMRSLLSAFDNLNGGADSIKQVADKMSGMGSEFSPSTVIELTMQCHQFMFQSQLTSNVANRTSDGIQQLFRQQS